MLRSVFVTLLPMAALIVSPAIAEPLYQEFDFGAPEQTVMSNYPTAKLDEANSAGSLRSYRLEDYPAGGMWAYFKFMRGGLVEVKFYGRGAGQYLRIVEGLRARYGTPASESSAAESGVAIWRRGSTTIRAQLDRSYSTIVGRVTDPFSVTYEHADESLENAL